MEVAPTITVQPINESLVPAEHRVGTVMIVRHLLNSAQVLRGSRDTKITRGNSRTMNTAICINGPNARNPCGL